MQIVISLERHAPPAGAVELRDDARPERHEGNAVPFSGWLELIRALESLLEGVETASER